MDVQIGLIKSFAIVAISFAGVVAMLRLKRWLPATFATSMAISLPLAFATFCGFVGVQGELTFPKQNWHWLSYVALLLAVTGGLGVVVKSQVVRAVSFCIAGALSAWLLFPDWPALQPVRLEITFALAAYLIALSYVYLASSSRATSRQTHVALIVTSLTLAVSIAAIFSFEYGELALVIALALVGCLLSSFVTSTEPPTLHAAMPCVATLLGGVAFVSCIYPQTPVYEFLLVPLAPLALCWTLSSREDVIGFSLRLLPFFLVLGIPVGIMVVRYGL